MANPDPLIDDAGGRIDALSVRCPRCDRPKGEPCGMRKDARMRHPHQSRIEVAALVLALEFYGDTDHYAADEVDPREGLISPAVLADNGARAGRALEVWNR